MPNLPQPPQRSTTAPPQSEVVDELVWSRMSRFWSANIDPSDRGALDTLYSAYLKALDAEYVRLFQLNEAKSIASCPLYTQRRWLRLDLNRYQELQAWLQFLSGGLRAFQGEDGFGGIPGAGQDQATCLSLPTKHTRHWHIHFPFVVDPAVPDPARRTINLGFPLTPSLVEGWRMVTVAGRTTGLRLVPNRDFRILSDGSSIEILQVAAGEEFEFSVALDLSDPEYNGTRPVVFQVQNVLGPRTVAIDPSMDTGHPVHALVVRNPPPGSSSGLTSTNNTSYTTERFFYPFTGDSSGVQRGVFGQVVLPASVSLLPDDEVFLFTTERGDFNTLHEHQRVSTQLTSQTANPAGTTEFTPPVALPLGLFGSIDSFGHSLKIFLDGKLLAPSEYRYDQPSNKIQFKTPVTFTSSVDVDILYTEESRALPASLPLLHLHYNCVLEAAETEEEYERFDTGWFFDDDTDPTPFFDLTVASNVIYIDFIVDSESLQIYVDGELRRPGVDFNVTEQEDGRTRIGFGFNVQGRSILVDYERTSALFTYGGIDLQPGGQSGSYGFTSDSISGALNDLQNLIDTFESQFGSSISNLSALIDAAFVAAAGGNPLLTLFFDEFPEYADLPINAAGSPISAFEARNVESADTRLVAIPFLVDHVHRPTVRLQQGVDYDVVGGAVTSSQDLTAPRGADDDSPGVWWCPLVVLDEQLLAKNFGALVGDVRPSSPRYRDALEANLDLRYGGPTLENIRNAAAVMLGSRAFSQDATIQFVGPEVTGWAVTVTSDSGSLQQTVEIPANVTPPTIGSPVIPGQSILSPLLYDGPLSTLDSWDGQRLVLLNELPRVAVGDTARILLYDPGDLSAEPVWKTFTIVSVGRKPVPSGVQTLIGLDQKSELLATSNSLLRIFRDVGEPYAAFEGLISAVSSRTRTIIQTEFEVFPLPEGSAPRYVEGDRVYRGDPVQPDLAVVYDDRTRPGWYRLRHQDVSQDWDYLLPSTQVTLRTDGLADERQVTIEPGSSGYAEAIFDPVTPLPPRGTRVLVSTVSGSTETFTVAGSNGTTVFLAPNAGASLVGTATLTPPDSTSAARSRDYFEVPAIRVSGGRPSSALSFDHQAYDPSLQIDSTVLFPHRGMLVIYPPEGGQIEVEYYASEPGKVFDLRWPGLIPALIDETGTFDPRIPAGSVVEVIYEYREYLLNPAFVSLVQQRVTEDASNPGGLANITDQNAEEYYELFRTSSAVLETRAVSRPEILRDTLEETIPPGTTLVVQSRHVIADRYVSEASETLANDEAVTYHPITITFTSPNGTVGAIQPDQLNLPLSSVEAVVGAVVTDPDGSSQTFQWSIQAVSGATAGLELVSPEEPETRIRGLQAGGRYLVTVDVENDRGTSKSAILTVLVDS